jgi:hypothetical protein
VGSMTRVTCRECGYESGPLFGVRGDIGLAGRPVRTVACDQNHALVDMWAPDDPASAKGYWYTTGMPMPGVPCPKCGEVHEVWDREEGVCPMCGATGCDVVPSGFWD